MKILRYMMLAFLATSLLLLASSAVRAYRVSQLQRQAAVASGTVVGLVKRVRYTEQGTEINYAPRVRFRTADGQEIQFESRTGNNPPAWRAGDDIEVLYFPEQPGRAEVNSFWQLWESVIVWVTIGGAFLLLSLAFAWFVRMAEREEAEAATARSCQAV